MADEAQRAATWDQIPGQRQDKAQGGEEDEGTQREGEETEWQLEDEIGERFPRLRSAQVRAEALPG